MVVGSLRRERRGDLWPARRGGEVTDDVLLGQVRQGGWSFALVCGGIYSAPLSRRTAQDDECAPPKSNRSLSFQSLLARSA